MRLRAVRALLGVGLFLGLILAGCVTPEPSFEGVTMTAGELLPERDLLGLPAEWMGEVPRREPQGDVALVMAYAIESAAPGSSRLVHELYNLREHLLPEETLGDGKTTRWLYQFRDETTMTLQHIASPGGVNDTGSWGAYWYWLPTHWSLGDPSRPVGDWSVDSDAAAAIAADHLEGWGDPAFDHIYMLYVPDGETVAHWLLGLWHPDGSEGEHLIVRATDAEVVPLETVHPMPEQRGAFEGELIQGIHASEVHEVVPDAPYGRLVVRVTPAVALPVPTLTVTSDGPGWEVAERTGAGATLVVVFDAVDSAPRTNLTVALADGAPLQRYTLDWCADGLFIDALDRTPDACDDLLVA